MFVSHESQDQFRHLIPAVFVQVPDIGNGIPGIQLFCNKINHSSCRDELRRALASGGRIVPGTYWHTV